MSKILSAHLALHRQTQTQGLTTHPTHVASHVAVVATVDPLPT